MKLIILMTCFVFLFFCGPGQDAAAFEDMNIEELQKLAAAGDADAQVKLGVTYSTGVNVEIDKKKAAEWYTKAAEQGSALGQWNLAFLYVRGEGVEEDEKKARELLKKAAAQGYAPAEYDIGMMYFYGIGGKRSRSEALEWMQKSAAQDYREAITFLKSQGEYKEEKPTE